MRGGVAVSAPRVPAGWTREAADFAWEDWRGALAGEPRMRPDDEGAYDDTTLAPEWRAALLLLSQRGHLTRAANDDGADYYWTSPEARLRAWAAVGAPVLTPEASRILDAARALPVALEGSEALAHVVSAVRAEAAAVGAPVLAPAEDGRPSLAEWVAACESLGMHSTMDVIGDDACICYWSTSQGGPCEYPVVRIRDAASVTVDTVTSDGHSVDTPAELRALLDTLAIEAR